MSTCISNYKENLQEVQEVISLYRYTMLWSSIYTVAMSHFIAQNRVIRCAGSYIVYGIARILSDSVSYLLKMLPRFENLSLIPTNLIWCYFLSFRMIYPNVMTKYIRQKRKKRNQTSNLKVVLTMRPLSGKWHPVWSKKQNCRIKFTWYLHVLDKVPFLPYRAYQIKEQVVCILYRLLKMAVNEV